MKYVVSTNCDNLHIKSGIPEDSLSLIHGDSYLEVCSTCNARHWRDYPVRNNWHRHEHETGRKCEVKGCGGDLLDTIVNFGEDELEEPWNKAVKNMKKADLVIVLGSSLRVRRSCDLPGMCFEDTDGKKNIRLVIVNLQKTPQNDRAQMVVHSRTDLLMQKVMNELSLEIDDYLFERTYELGVEVLTDGTKRVYLRDPGYDRHIATVVDGVTFRILYENGSTEEKDLKYRWDDLDYLHNIHEEVANLEAILHFNFTPSREEGGNRSVLTVSKTDTVEGGMWSQFLISRRTSDGVIKVSVREKQSTSWECMVI